MTRIAVRPQKALCYFVQALPKCGVAWPFINVMSLVPCISRLAMERCEVTRGESQSGAML